MSDKFKKRQQPIGVFDSGLGGLTVVQALRQVLPYEDILYFGDTARVPYGTKSREAIIRFSKQNADILFSRGVKMIIVACNSSSSHAMPALRKKFKIPIVGVIEPGVKKAVSLTRNKRIGIIATPATIRSDAYAGKIRKHDPSIRVINQACPLFVPLVEEGWYHTDITHRVAAAYLENVKNFGVDTLVLGCTHYPLMKVTLREVMGPDVALVDSAQEVALEAKALLEKLNLNGLSRRKPRYQFLVSDAPQHFYRSARKFLRFPIKNVRRCDHFPTV